MLQGLKQEERVWSRFRLDGLFEVNYGKFISNNKEEIGVPYITTTAQNNGISGKVKGKPMYQGNCLTVASDGSVGETFYQETPFSTSNIVSTLQPKMYLNKYISFFIAPLIKKESYRYGYGRKFSVEKVRSTEIMLPSITLESGKVVPDYVFMEQYVKTLKYGKVL